MTKYTVYGQMYVNKQWNSFIKEMEADSDSRVREKTMTRLGSDHGLKRTQIKIDKVEAVKA